MKEIQLTRGMVALVSDHRFDYLNQFEWYALECEHTVYAARKIWNGKYSKETSVMMHRDILGIIDKPELMVDHRNGNGLDCRDENIRIATSSQNNMNKKGWGSVGYKGVTLNPIGRAVARIGINRKKIHIGTFDTIEQAALAYNDKALELFGEFAKLNVIE